MNQIALDFIKQHEGCRLTAYLDSGGTATIGYGATGPEIVSGLTWTQEQADARLVSDLAQFEAAVKRLIAVPLSERQEAALISFCFNVGAYALEQSTLRTLLNKGDVLGAAKEIPRWDHAGGRELRGLLIRRFEEAALFLRGAA